MENEMEEEFVNQIIEENTAKEATEHLSKLAIAGISITGAFLCGAVLVFTFILSEGYKARKISENFAKNIAKTDPFGLTADPLTGFKFVSKHKLSVLSNLISSFLDELDKFSKLENFTIENPDSNATNDSSSSNFDNDVTNNDFSANFDYDVTNNESETSFSNLKNLLKQISSSMNGNVDIIPNNILKTFKETFSNLGQPIEHSNKNDANKNRSTTCGIFNTQEWLNSYKKIEDYFSSKKLERTINPKQIQKDLENIEKTFKAINKEIKKEIQTIKISCFDAGSETISKARNVKFTIDFTKEIHRYPDLIINNKQETPESSLKNQLLCIKPLIATL